MAVGALQGMAYAPGFAFYFVAVVSLVTGSLFLMWLGEQITERGVGNGISMLIFAGIVAGLPRAIGQSLEQARQGEMNWLVLAFIVLLAAAVIFLVVFIERGQRRITVNYAKQQRGNRVYQAQSSHLPLEGQYGRCNSGDFRQLYPAVSGIDSAVVRQGQWQG